MRIDGYPWVGMYEIGIWDVIDMLLSILRIGGNFS